MMPIVYPKAIFSCPVVHECEGQQEYREWNLRREAEKWKDGKRK